MALTFRSCVFAARHAHQYVLDSGLLFHETYTDVPRFAYLDFAEGFVSLNVFFVSFASV